MGGDTFLHRKKENTIAINTGLPAYTFTKLGDNLTNSDGELSIAKLKLDVKYT